MVIMIIMQDRKMQLLKDFPTMQTFIERKETVNIHWWNRYHFCCHNV